MSHSLPIPSGKVERINILAILPDLICTIKTEQPTYPNLRIRNCQQIQQYRRIFVLGQHPPRILVARCRGIGWRQRSGNGSFILRAGSEQHCDDSEGQYRHDRHGLPAAVRAFRAYAHGRSSRIWKYDDSVTAPYRRQPVHDRIPGSEKSGVSMFSGASRQVRRSGQWNLATTESTCKPERLHPRASLGTAPPTYEKRPGTRTFFIVFWKPSPVFRNVPSDLSFTCGVRRNAHRVGSRVSSRPTHRRRDRSSRGRSELPCSPSREGRWLRHIPPVSAPVCPRCSTTAGNACRFHVAVLRRVSR